MSLSFFFIELEFVLEAYASRAGTISLEHNSSLFFSGYFGDGVSQTICIDRPKRMIFPISASAVVGL
jgi:hypothetical protein